MPAVVERPEGAWFLAGAAMPLWVAGLALAVLFLGALALPLSGERAEWAGYLLLGTVFPVLAIAVVTRQRRGSPSDIVVGSIQALATAIFLVAGCAFLARHGSVGLLALGLATWALGVFSYRGGLGRAPAPMTPVESLVGLFLVTLSTVVASRMTSWAPLLTVVSQSFYTVSVFVGALLLTVRALCRPRPQVSRGLVRYGGTLAGLLVLAFASLRVQSVHSGVFHHWGVAVGPAELVRQGGWLLWDVPAQYGFLSTLILAGTPGQTIWDAFLLLNSTLLFLSASVLFLLLRGTCPDPVDLAFALAVTVAAVFLLPGFPQYLSGSWMVPNVGPFRFFWCHALLAILFWHCRAGPTGRSLAVASGTLAWLAGTLWSVESAAYAAVIWLPAYALLVARQQATGRLAAIAWRLAVPPLLLLAVSLALVAHYRGRLGHGPDWRAFVEYAIAFAGGFMALPMDRGGAVWTLLLAAVTVATVGLRLLAGRPSPSALALGWGAWAAVWATGSYFVSRSHETNATNLAPVFCVALAVALRLLSCLDAADSVARLARLTLVPIFAVLLGMTFGNGSGVWRFVTDPRPWPGSGMEALLPRVDPALADLLAQARVEAGEPVAYIGSLLNPLPARPIGQGERWAAGHHAWLPTAPAALFLPLGEERGRTYVRRFTRRTERDGWLIEWKALPPRLRIPWLIDEVRRTYTTTAVYENEAWRLTRFERR
jgi:hypothetical protein